MLVRDESDDSMAEVRQAKRFAKREMLARQTSGAKARTMLRRLVAERLSHPLLEQIKSSGFDDNPLEEEDEPDYRPPPSLAKWMAEVSQTDAAEEAPAPAVPAMVGSIGEGEQGINELVALKRHLENDVAYSDGLTVCARSRRSGRCARRRSCGGCSCRSTPTRTGASPGRSC
jgi:hypothetical protein